MKRSKDSSISKLNRYAAELAAQGFEIEITTPESFTAFLENDCVIEADCMTIELNIEKFSWDEYFN